MHAWKMAWAQAERRGVTKPVELDSWERSASTYMPLHHDHGLKMGLLTYLWLNNPGYSISIHILAESCWKLTWQTRATAEEVSLTESPTALERLSHSESKWTLEFTRAVHESFWPSCFVTLSLSDLFSKMRTVVRPYWNLIGNSFRWLEFPLKFPCWSTIRIPWNTG